jgi:hypothetical protein
MGNEAGEAQEETRKDETSPGWRGRDDESARKRQRTVDTVD